MWQKIELYSCFLYALFDSCHGIWLNQDRNRNQLEIKINTWFLFESIPKPTPILHPSRSQYQNQGSKSKIRIQYQYWSRNQPVSHIPALLVGRNDVHTCDSFNLKCPALWSEWLLHFLFYPFCIYAGIFAFRT